MSTSKIVFTIVIVSILATISSLVSNFNLNNQNTVYANTSNLEKVNKEENEELTDFLNSNTFLLADDNEEPIIDYSGDEEIITGDDFEEEIIENDTENKNVAEETEQKTSIVKSVQTVKAEVKRNSSPYYIKVNNAQNVVTIYTKDQNGEYTVPTKAMVCSTGTSTPRAGEKYAITTYRKTWNGLKGNVYGQYAVQIVGNILFHSVPYTAKNNSSLEYWEYDKLGTKASLGCIRLTVADAKWIYDYVPAGTWVEFYSDEINPGPLGKPTAKVISDNELCRNWDPTDNVEGNPWFMTIEEQDALAEVIAPIESGENIIIDENSLLENNTNEILEPVIEQEIIEPIAEEPIINDIQETSGEVILEENITTTEIERIVDENSAEDTNQEIVDSVKTNNTEESIDSEQIAEDNFAIMDMLFE